MPFALSLSVFLCCWLMTKVLRNKWKADMGSFENNHLFATTRTTVKNSTKEPLSFAVRGIFQSHFVPAHQNIFSIKKNEFQKQTIWGTQDGIVFDVPRTNNVFTGYGNLREKAKRYPTPRPAPRRAADAWASCVSSDDLFDRWKNKIVCSPLQSKSRHSIHSLDPQQSQLAICTT